jgi:hypothetical protein
MIGKILEFFNGKKTYITALVAAICGLLQASGVVIPEYVFIILASLGISFVRASIK